MNHLKVNTMKRRNIFLILVLVALFFTGCKYDFILPVPTTPIDNGGNPISFATQIAPIFSADGCTACHKPGSQTPDLTSANAYSQLVPNFVNVSSPASSILLTFPGPGSSNHTWKQLTANNAALILAWINEGAKNN